MLTALVGGVISILPLFFVKLGGDAFYQYSLLASFTEQVWQGDVFPRWCNSCNGSVGSPVFLFYFPLPYYVASIFYPLRTLGLGIEHFYLLLLAIVSGVTVLACYVWLQSIVSPRVALAGAFLYIWLPYRNELIYHRSAYTELWAMAFIPLLFWAVRHISHGRREYWCVTSICVAMLLLCHVTVGISAVGLALAYLILVGKESYKQLPFFVGCILLALAAVSFYLLPAHAMLQYLNPEGLQSVANSWVNNFADVISSREFNITNYYKLIETILIYALIMIVFFIKRKRLTNPLIRREAWIWVILAAAVFIFMFSITRPLWNILQMLGIFVSPWRLQQFISLTIIFLFSINQQWLLSAKQEKTKILDYIVLLGLFITLSFSYIMQRDENTDKKYEEMIEARVIGFPEYQPRWVHGYNFSHINHIADEFYQRLDKLYGTGLAGYTVKLWQSTQLTAHVSMKNSGTLTLRHQYFPIWQAYVDGKSVELYPDKKQGLMQLSIPAGEHDLTIMRNTQQALPFYARYCWILSLLVWGLLLWQIKRHKALKAISPRELL